MLGSEVLAVRMAGIYALGRLANDHPEQYYVQIMQLLCSFVRYPSTSEAPTVRGESSARVDTYEAVTWIGGHRNHGVEAVSEYQLDLNGAHLQDAYLGGADLSSASLENANLQRAWLANTNLSGAFMWRANLHAARFEGATLVGADLWLANVSEADFEETSFVDADLVEANFSTELTDLDHYIEFRQVDFRGADLTAANLTGAKCIGARFDGAELRMTNLTGADLSSGEDVEVSGLTQDQVEQIRWEGENVPNFEGTMDSSTSKPIEGPTGLYTGLVVPEWYL